MSWKIALLVALIAGIITAVATAPVADKVTKMHGVSDFEGGRGMLIVFGLIPAGFFGGALLGLLGTKLAHAVEWSQFWKALGLSVLLGQVALFGIAGLSLLSIPKAPTHEGHTLSLEVEVSVPRARITPRSLEPDQIRMSLYAGPKDNAYAPIQRDHFREEGDHLIIPAVVPLNSASTTRVLSFLIEEHTWLAFDLPLPPIPTIFDQWTLPTPMRDARSSGPDVPRSDVLIRYRTVRDPTTLP